MGLQAGDPLALQVSSPAASCTLWMAEEDPLSEPGWEQDAPTSTAFLSEPSPALQESLPSSLLQDKQTSAWF